MRVREMIKYLYVCVSVLSSTLGAWKHFLSRFEAASVLLALGINKQNATISVLNTSLDRILTQPESVLYQRAEQYLCYI